ncbi:hypothetical protein [Halothermothrix orenii]|uniref:RiboL-PSP-HEPN domain-containing protein n=1 Tax=Halothermothrix orenii (strain H 168 / OCM 544 / DSM 9562) TaxID=373903 RepID=B8CXV9_HALOH|nr:hypothetical protein [Halothermothrix orenii]ACL70128.1 hypothetical protein Hore_13760 [Halothermothrix orenii H 168]
MPENKQFIFESFVNSFHYLYQDALFFQEQAENSNNKNSFDHTRFCRTALLLYIFSLEGLINRVMDHFLPEYIKSFIMRREQKFSIEDKWELVPLLCSKNKKMSFDKSSYPWSHFSELIRLRNDFVHPKHNRSVYYKAKTYGEWIPLSWKDIPEKLEVKEKDIIYRQTQIPKDPYAIRVEHVKTAKKVVDDIVNKLDEYLDGKLTKENWIHNDKMKLVYPENANLDDLPK